MLLFDWLPRLEIFKDVYIPVKHSFISSMLIFNVPDALWFLSGVLFLRFLWFYNEKWQGIYIIIFYGIAVLFETSQIAPHIPGTFDVMDLLFMGITAFVEGLLYKNLVKGRIKK